jgi:transposase
LVLIPIARESLSFPLAMAIEGQWKEMSLQKTEKYWKRTDASCPIFWFIDCFRQKTVGQKGIRMQLKTILNRVQKHQSFIYTDIQLKEDKQLKLYITIRPRRNSHPICSGCGGKCPGYDTLPVRRFEFIPFWGILVYFVYAMRRVNCPDCGIKVERVPWADGKRTVTNAYAWFLARWARQLSWAQVAEAFRTSWYTVYSSVEMAVQWGRANVNLAGITAIGVDELCWGKWHRYVTVVYQINRDSIRLLWVGEKRTAKTLLRFFRWFGKPRTKQLKYVCSDMWKPYLKVIAKKASQAIHILDRFHIVAHMNKAIDKVRAAEAKDLEHKGYVPILKKSRWLFLKRPENLTGEQDTSLARLLQYNLKTVRSYLLKEDFQFFWEYRRAYWAGWFLDRWCTRAMRSRIEPMKKVASMLRRHKELILNWFRAKKEFSSGVVEGLNAKAKVTTRKSYGFKSFKTLELALYHNLGALPQPIETHKLF